MTFFDAGDDEEPLDKDRLRNMYLKQEKELEGSDFENDMDEALFMGMNDEDDDCIDEPLIELPDHAGALEIIDEKGNTIVGGNSSDD